MNIHFLLYQKYLLHLNFRQLETQVAKATKPTPQTFASVDLFEHHIAVLVF